MSNNKFFFTKLNTKLCKNLNNIRNLKIKLNIFPINLQMRLTKDQKIKVDKICSKTNAKTKKN